MIYEFFYIKHHPYITYQLINKTKMYKKIYFNLYKYLHNYCHNNINIHIILNPFNNKKNFFNF